ncbi:hypothetical protein FJZ31_18765 [Candidatus Poribacteria bacterium]|nr:hypothetical protein [Candidatus Poribacteria bacterium]
MKGTKFFGLRIALAACILALLLAVEAGFVSTALAGKPPNPPTSTKYGYVMFRDATGDVIRSDGRGQYIDCQKGGEDVVWINVRNNDGSLNWVEFYPGKMYYHHPSFPPSTRRIKFLFNVSAISTGQTGNAVRDILRWYKGEDGAYNERSTNPGYLEDNSLHAPIFVNGTKLGFDSDGFVQFVVEPDVSSPGTDAKAITQAKVDDYYSGDDNVTYWSTINEPVRYIIYTLDYSGFTVTPVQWDRKKKPVTWTIEATGNPVLYVKLTDFNGGKVFLVDSYTVNLPFAFAVSLNPLTTYPRVSGAPRKDSTLSTTWGEIKNTK